MNAIHLFAFQQLPDGIAYNKLKMKDIGIALIYIAFFSLIGFSLWVTKSLWVLLALIFTPDFHSR